MPRLFADFQVFMPKTATTALVSVALTCLAITSVVPQRRANPSPVVTSGGEVLGLGSYSPIVDDLERSLTFYRDRLGLDVPPPAKPGPRPYTLNRGLLNMLGTPEGKERHVAARVPGVNLSAEILEIQNVERTPTRLRFQDPGTITLAFLVRDIDAMAANLKASGVPSLTPSGLPVMMEDGSRSILVEDPDGRPIQLTQPNPLPETTAPATSNIVGARVIWIVGDTDRMVHAYRDVLGGFQVQSDRSFAADAGLRALTGLKNAQVRRSHLRAPGSPVVFDLLEFRGVDRKPLTTRLQDPGSTRMQVRVRDLDAVIAKMKSLGSHVVGKTGASVPVMPNLRVAVMPDPNNLYLTLIEPCDGCAPRVPPQEIP
jgi:catechol 2,3-dioxygenase-like lactoylglutathione lyase family enzyme